MAQKKRLMIFSSLELGSSASSNILLFIHARGSISLILEITSHGSDSINMKRISLSSEALFRLQKRLGRERNSL